MAVEKSIDLTATGSSIEDAVEEAIGRASLTLTGLTNFELVSIDGLIDGADVTYKVVVRIWFVIKEKLHE